MGGVGERDVGGALLGGDVSIVRMFDTMNRHRPRLVVVVAGRTNASSKI